MDLKMQARIMWPVALGIIVRIIIVWFWDCMTNSKQTFLELKKEHQRNKLQSTPILPWTEIRCRPRIFTLTVFYQGSKHEHVTKWT